MHQRERLEGWSQILGPEEDALDKADKAEQRPTHGPVGEVGDRVPTVIDPSAPRPTLLPGRPHEADAALSRGGSAARRLRLPLPGRAGSSGFPSPGLPASGLPASGLPASGLPASGLPAPSSANSIAKLSDERAEPEVPISPWREYKEVLRTAIIGVLLLAAAIGYRRMQTVQPTVPVVGRKAPRLVTPERPPSIISAPPQSRALEEPLSAVAEPPPPEDADPNAPGRSSTPMVTILSSPRGAWVEINGVLYGKTPLVMSSPKNLTDLTVRLKLDKYKQWDAQIGMNEAGHFTVNASLKPNSRD